MIDVIYLLFLLLLVAAIGLGICLWIIYMIAAVYNDTD